MMEFFSFTRLLTEGNTGVQHVHEDVDLLDIDPLTRDGGGNVRLVLMVGGNQIDLPALAESPESSIAIWAARVEPAPPRSE